MTDQSSSAPQPDPAVAPPYSPDEYSASDHPPSTYPPDSYPPSTYPPSTYPPSTYPPSTSPQIYAFQPRDHPQGTTVLVLGILSLFIGICGPFAWHLGSKTLAEIRGSGLRYDNEQQIVIGRLIGLVITVIGIVAIVFALVFLIITVLTVVVSS